MPFALLDLIVCPACHGRLSETAAEGGAVELVCVACSRRYAVQDGIPVLIPDRSRS